MTEGQHKTGLLFKVVAGAGIGCFVYGSVVTLLSTFTFVQVRTGWGLTPFERCCTNLDVASLGGALAGMFFSFLGSVAILLLQPIRIARARSEGKTLARWPRILAILLAIYAIGVFALATSIAGMSEEFDGFATGLVNYCMLIGVGMLGVAWGFKRASEAR